MFASTPSTSLVGLVLGLLCHTAGGPVLGQMAVSLQTQAGEQPDIVVQAPARAAVRDFEQSTPIVAPMPVYAPPQGAVQPVPTIAVPDPEPSVDAGRTIEPVESQSDTIVSEQETQLVDLINRERVGQGENPLAIDPLLVRIARQHSEDMCVRNYFDHYAPTPGPATPMDRYIAALPERPDYAMVGENIYYRSMTESPTDYAAEAHTAFMNSPGHRANILTAQYTQVGVGIYVNPATGEFWVTEMFLRDRE